jgi:hypothetical protein
MVNANEGNLVHVMAVVSETKTEFELLEDCWKEEKKFWYYNFSIDGSLLIRSKGKKSKLTFSIARL